MALALVVLLCAGAGATGAPQLTPLPNGRQEYVDPARHIAFQMPVDFTVDESTPLAGDPPYQVAFKSENGKIQVRLNMEELSGQGDVATPDRLRLWATTYAMNRFGRRHPKDVLLLPALPPARVAALCSVVGPLPAGGRYQTEKSVFVAVAPNRIYIITMLFDEGDLQEALQVADVLPTTVRVVAP